MFGFFRDSAAIIPIKNAPLTFMTNVPNGKAQLSLASIIPRRYLATEPKKPPKPTAKQFNMLHLLANYFWSNIISTIAALKLHDSNLIEAV